MSIEPAGRNPGLVLLDALSAGDDEGALAVCGPTTVVSAANVGWSCRGREEIRAMLADARDRFPGLTFEARTRDIGFGLVIEEARVRDLQPEPETDGEPADGHDVEGAVGRAVEPAPDHPMYDDPTFKVRRAGGGLVLWRDLGGDEPPAPLNMPVRVTVNHDDLQVHEVSLSFPGALLRRALGERVDPFELSLSEVQSAFVAPAAAVLTTRDLTEHGTVGPPSPDPDNHDEAPEVRRPRRRRRKVLLLLLALAVLSAGAWEVLHGRIGGPLGPDASSATPSASVSASVSASAAPSAAPSPAPSAAPSPSRVTQSTGSKSRTPTVTLRSDLAFGVGSARLSGRAKNAVAEVARQIRANDLKGRIHVDGYTDSTGSAAYGLQLSQQRADAVSAYLRSRLTGSSVSIVSVGHGEAHPVADNATPAGRKANRRVTITLPRH